jgi:hypothetical protein
MDEYLNYLTPEAYKKLLDNCKQNEEKYLNEKDNSWIKEFLNMEEYFKVSKIKIKPFKLRLLKGNESDEEVAKIDLANAKIVYKAIRITRAQAANPYVWTYLAHCNPHIYEYIHNRWCTNEKDRRENTVATRFFAADSARSFYYDCGIARLWWSVELSYDKDAEQNFLNFVQELKEARKNKDIAKINQLKSMLKKDGIYAKPKEKFKPCYRDLLRPYNLTEVLMICQTHTKDMLDTKHRNNFTRMKGVLYGIKNYIYERGSTKGIIDIVREANKRINADAAFRSYVSLEWGDIAEEMYLALQEVSPLKKNTEKEKELALV